MDIDIGIVEIVGVISSSTTGYLVTFSPVFLLMGGIILAFVVMAYLIGLFTGSRPDLPDFDDEAFNAKADELEEFYSRRGRTTADYDITRMGR